MYTLALLYFSITKNQAGVILLYDPIVDKSSKQSIILSISLIKKTKKADFNAGKNYILNQDSNQTADRTISQTNMA